MIQSIQLSRMSCFAEGEEVGNLKAVNYIFGPNGSGKTTISNCATVPLDGDNPIRWSGAERTIKVYNRDFVRRAFVNANSQERGVFLLGEESGEIIDQIRELESEREKAEEKKSRFAASLLAKETERINNRRPVEEEVWRRRDLIPDNLRKQMRGLSGSKAKCLDIVAETLAGLVERGASETEDGVLDELADQAEVAFAEESEVRSLFPEPPVQIRDVGPIARALSTPIVGSSDVPIAMLIEKLGISDWVRQGVEHIHPDAEGRPICPFCQQQVPLNLENQLVQIFDQEYQNKIAEMEHFKNLVAAAQSEFLAYKDKYGGILKLEINQAEVDKAFDAAELIIAGMLDAIMRKLMNPSEVVAFHHQDSYDSPLKAVVDEANRKIRSHNQLIEKRYISQRVIVKEAWEAFSLKSAKGLVNEYMRLDHQLGRACEGIQRQIATQEQLMEQFDSQLKLLRAKTVSSDRAIDDINAMLRMGQFHSFSLRKAGQKAVGYQIVRDNGEVASVDTLSEGERTFITFLYFFHSLSEVRQDGETEKIAVIIDDPISSLDGDVLFVVSALTRQLIRAVREGGFQRVEQLILLTHNTKFHNEVSYVHGRGQSTSDKFYRIRKLAPAPNRVEDCGNRNPIRSSYQELWDEVAAAKGSPESNAPWLPNVLRRILESYFTTLGGEVNLYELGSDLSGPERILCEGMIAWAHSGSHSIMDAEVYESSSYSNERWIGAFTRIFEEGLGGVHFGHYEMMMREAEVHLQ